MTDAGKATCAMQEVKALHAWAHLHDPSSPVEAQLQTPVSYPGHHQRLTQAYQRHLHIQLVAPGGRGTGS